MMTAKSLLKILSKVLVVPGKLQCAVQSFRASLIFQTRFKRLLTVDKGEIQSSSRSLRHIKQHKSIQN